MRQIRLGSWIIRCFTEEYTLWKNSDEESVIVEYNSDKIATITLREDGSYVILSKNAYCEVNEEQHLIIFWSPNDVKIPIEI